MTVNRGKNLKGTALLAAFALLITLSGCGDNPGSVTGSSRDEIFDRIDQDGDGVALRSDYEMALSLTDRTRVIASYPRGELTIGSVLVSLAESRPSRLLDPDNPPNEIFVARLTSMLRLRLAAIAINDAGFDIDFEVDDENLNSQVQEHISGEFEQWAQQYALAEDPRLEKFATPHCITLIATETETETEVAKKRLEAGESASVVASEVNAQGATRWPNGDVGCADLLTWANTFGESAAPLGEMEAGDISEIVSMSSDFSATGRLWLVFYVRELRNEEANPATLGPFSQRVLADLVVGYDVAVDPQVGNWDSDGLSVAPSE
ncbi:MAG: hypothetical protein QF696_01940 [Acidimicrobiales bacterium]|nr:hypothetical protein [Acidimicrobiales bacterium]HJL99703.1 hypothetical protein [Acidimicrobiales bacterium]